MKKNLFIAATLAAVVGADAWELEIVKRIVPIQPQVNSLPVVIPAGRRVNTWGEHVVLRNGDVIRGKFIDFDLAKGLIWQHPDISPDLNIATGNIASMAFASTVPANARSQPSKIFLKNGNLLTGKLVRLENNKAILDTWYAGELAVDLAHIKTLHPGYSRDKVLFEGPMLQKNWTNTNGNWQFKDGTFTTTTSGAMIGRHLDEMPGRAAINFEVSWQNHLNLYINFRTDALNSYSACNGYSLRLAQTYVYLYRYTQVNRVPRGARVGGRVSVNLNTANQHARVSIKVNEKTGVLALYINGKFITKWKDLNGVPSPAKGLLFTSRTTNRIIVKQIQVAQWNGGLPGQAKPAVGATKEDTVLFNNEDTMTGQIVGIRDSKMQIKSKSFGQVEIPLENVNVVHLADGKKLPPTIDPKTKVIPVRAEIHGRDTLAGSISRWKDGQVILHSPIFGQATLKAAAIQSLVFINPAAPQKTGQAPGSLRLIPGAGSVDPAAEQLREPRRLRAVPRRR